MSMEDRPFPVRSARSSHHQGFGQDSGSWPQDQPSRRTWIPAAPPGPNTRRKILTKRAASRCDPTAVTMSANRSGFLSVQRAARHDLLPAGSRLVLLALAYSQSRRWRKAPRRDAPRKSLRRSASPLGMLCFSLAEMLNWYACFLIAISLAAHVDRPERPAIAHSGLLLSLSTRLHKTLRA